MINVSSKLFSALLPSMALTCLSSGNVFTFAFSQLRVREKYNCAYSGPDHTNTCLRVSKYLRSH